MEIIDDTEIIEIDENDFCEETVVETRLDKDYTYDIEVDDNHHYILENGIVSHNTISLSIGQNCSSGVEPSFELAYTRKYRTGRDDETASEMVYDYAWLNYIEYITGNEITDGVEVERPDWFTTTTEVDPYDSIDIQAIFQKYIDHSISKCVARGTLISTNKGIIPIEELSNTVYDKADTFSDVNDNYYVIDEFGKEQKIMSHYYNGKQKGIDLKFSNGMEITGSYVHKLKTPEGWMRLDDLQIGDSVFYRKTEMNKNVDYVELEQPNFYNHIKIKYPKFLDENYAKFIGMLLADGHIGRNGIYICEKDENVNKELSNLFNKLFNKEKIRIDKRNGVRNHELYSRAISKLMNKWLGSNALTKRVPDEILRSKKSVQIAFIEGLTLDGCVTQDDHLLIYEGYSKDIRDKVGHMLASMGLRYYLGSKSVPTGKLSQKVWSVRVYLDDKLLNPIETHKQKYTLSTHSHENVFFPEEMIDDYMKLPKTNSQNYNDRRNLRRSLRVSSFVRRSLLENLKLIEKIDKDLIEVKIVSKEYIDEIEMYDIEVENTHSYLIGGIISHNTLNLPPGTTREDYNKLFLYAYKKGLKGFTTFNSEGSLKGILEYNEPKKVVEDGSPQLVERHMAPERPEELECDIHEVTVNKEKHIVLVGKLHGSLYEIFIDSNDDGEIDVNHHKNGIIKKNGKGMYSLIIRNGTDNVAVNNLAKAFDGTYGSLARFVSMTLRHGAPLQFIVEQLQKSKHFVSFEKTVARVLKKYIKDGEVVQTGEICPVCENTLTFKDGCVNCRDCGWNQCS